MITDDKVVLLIEDNPDDERLTLRALRKNNIMNEVVVAYDGQEALDYLFGSGKFEGRNVEALPSLIVLDLTLPRVTGLEVLQRIRERELTKLVPVVVLTSSDEESAMTRAYELGANSYVKKSTDSSEYSDMVLNVAMYWLLLNQTAPPRTSVAAT